MVVRDKIDLNEVGISNKCRKYFVQIFVIYDFLLEEHEDVAIEDFCSLYVLLGIYDFLLPN